MTAPAPARARLFTVYAFNLELARAAWTSDEPMLCRMRLQFWRDIVAAAMRGDAPTKHDVARPVHELIQDAGLEEYHFNTVIDAWDETVEARSPGELDMLTDRLRQTGGGLMQIAARALDAPCDIVAGNAGFAQAVTAYLEALPGLVARGLNPLPNVSFGTPDAPLATEARDAIAALAENGLAALASARAARASVPPPARPALRAAWRAERLLSAMAEPGRDLTLRDLSGTILPRDRRRLLLLTLTGRY